MKKIIILVIGIMLLLGSITAFASAPNTYSFTVTNDKLVYQVGDSIELVFKHGSLSNRYDQIDFSAQIYVENGVPYIEFTPSFTKFNKSVTIKVNKFEGTWIDKNSEEPVKVHLDKHQFKVDHFSRYIVQN